MQHRLERLFRPLLIGLPVFWLLLFFVLPFALVLKISLADPIIAQPPFTPMFDWSKEGFARLQLTLDNFLFLSEDKLYWISYLNSIRIALISTLLCLLIGYPMAYAIARAPGPWKLILLLLIILPFWTSFLLRVYAWMGLLGTHGLINDQLLAFGLIDAPLKLMYTDFAVLIGIVYSYLPFMILPMYASLEKLDLALHDAAADLGARPAAVFLEITLPMSLPGVIAGSLLVFIPALGEFVIPSLLGGIDTLMIGRTLYDEFFINRDWPLASAVATILLLVAVVPIMAFQRAQMRD